MTAGRWVLLIAIALLVIGLIGYARGVDHQRGDERGEEARAEVVVVA